MSEKEELWSGRRRADRSRERKQERWRVALFFFLNTFVKPLAASAALGGFAFTGSFPRCSGAVRAVRSHPSPVSSGFRGGQPLPPWVIQSGSRRKL